MFYGCFSSLAESWDFFYLSTFFKKFSLWSAGTRKSHGWVFFFISIIAGYFLLAGNWLSVCISLLFHFFRVFHISVTGGLSLQSKQQHFYPALQSSSQYSRRMVSILPRISNPSILFLQTFETFPIEPSTNGITIILMLHIFFSPSAKSKHLWIWHLLWLLLWDVLRVFYTSVGWRSSTGVWVTASLLGSPRLFLVFCPNTTMPMVLIHPPISNSSKPLSIPLWIVPSALISVGIHIYQSRIWHKVNF